VFTFFKKYIRSESRHSNPFQQSRLTSELRGHTQSQGEYLLEDIASLFTPSFKGPDIGEEKTERLTQDGSERMFQPETHSPFPLPLDSKVVKPTLLSSPCEKDEKKP